MNGLSTAHPTVLFAVLFTVRTSGATEEVNTTIPARLTTPRFGKGKSTEPVRHAVLSEHPKTAERYFRVMSNATVGMAAVLIIALGILHLADDQV